MFMIFANANPSKGYKGITCFLVPAGTPGLIVGKKVRCGARGGLAYACACECECARLGHLLCFVPPTCTDVHTRIFAALSLPCAPPTEF